MKAFNLFCLTALSLFLILASCNSPTKKVVSNINPEINTPGAMFMSDFHIGEVYGGVTRILPDNDTLKLGYIAAAIGIDTIYYRNEINNIVHSLDSITHFSGKKIPFIVLLGDIFDMAVHDEVDALNLTHLFFTKVKFESNYSPASRSFISFFDNIIYLPGNHDHHVWKMLQEEYYISQHLTNYGYALKLPQQSPGVLNLNNNEMLVQDSIIFPDKRNNFISSVLSDNLLDVYVAYPNLYIEYGEVEKNNEKSGVCVTHGHFFEPGWNKSSLNFDGKIRHMDDAKYFSELEKNNSPLTEFSDFAVAQTFDTLAQGISDLQFGYSDYEPIYEKLSALYPQLFPIKMEKSHKTKDFDEITLNEYSQLVDTFLVHTKSQMKSYNIDFKELIYGHTHVPCFNLNYDKAFSLKIYNTGGWVNINEVSRPNPMFLYAKGKIVSVLPLNNY